MCMCIFFFNQLVCCIILQALTLVLVFIRIFTRMDRQVKCPDCKKSVSRHQLKDHIAMCKSYNVKVLKDTINLAQSLNCDDLQFLIAQLEMAKQTIKSKLGQPVEHHNNYFGSYQTVRLFASQQAEGPVYANLQDLFGKSDTIPVIQTKGKPQQKQADLTEAKSNEAKSQQKQQLLQKIQEQTVTCQNCSKIMKASEVNQFAYNYSCLHLFCIDCVKSYAHDQFVAQKGNLKCLARGCKMQFMADQVRQILGIQQFDKLQAELLRSMMEFTKCCKCNRQYEFSEGHSKDAPKTDQSGKKITKAQAEHYAKNRFVCPNPSCKQEQCKLCKIAPYHLGRSCTQNLEFKNAKKCRYCGNPLKKGYTSNLGIKAFDDICQKKQCEKMTKKACAKIHSCNHPCMGYIRQSKCLPCLNEACTKSNKVPHDQNEDSYCSICYIEGLKASPCVMSKCGHIFHYACLQKRLQIRWLTPRILFGFCHCPLCKQWLELPSDCPLSTLINKNKQLYQELKQKSLNRLKYEKLQKDQKIIDKKSDYYQKPIDYAMAIYAYFECFKCKKPYFGGRKSCAQMMNQESSTGSHAPFDADKLICPSCCPVETKNCSKHGKQFIAFKCKFCCNIGLWFCWGSTHFCDDCHKRQQKGEYISKLPKQKLPKCEGKDKCPSGGDHGENGNQFSIGCLLCKNYKDEIKDF